MMPRLAMIMMVVLDATREPKDELRKLTASLLTPTIMSRMAIVTRMPTPIRRNSLPMMLYYPFHIDLVFNRPTTYTFLTYQFLAA
jgi:hypothetical protein